MSLDGTGVLPGFADCAVSPPPLFAFGGEFFCELEARGGEIVGFNDRTGHFLTPQELEDQARQHPLLRHVPFYPCRV